MAIHRYGNPSSIDSTQTDLQNFGLTETLTTANQTSDSYEFAANRNFLIIVDATAGFTGSLLFQMKLGNGSWFTSQSFTSTTQIKMGFTPTRDTLWQFKCGADFSGSVTVTLAQSKCTNYALG